MTERTYRFYTGAPLYPFGYGLSYTSFTYAGLRVQSADENKIVCSVSVSNTGAYDGAEKVQCYARFADSRTVTPNLQLCAVAPVFLKRGETKTVTFEIDRFWLKAVLPDGTRAEPDGGVTLYVGGGQPDPGDEGVAL